MISLKRYMQWNWFLSEYTVNKELKEQWKFKWNSYSVQFSSVTQSCLTICYPMNCSTPGLPAITRAFPHPQRGFDTDRPRDGRDVAINPGMRDLQQKLEEARSRFSPWSLQKDCGLSKTLISAPGHQFQTSRLQNLENTFLLFQATQTAIICPSSHKKLK